MLYTGGFQNHVYLFIYFKKYPEKFVWKICVSKMSILSGNISKIMATYIF